MSSSVTETSLVERCRQKVEERAKEIEKEKQKRQREEREGHTKQFRALLERYALPVPEDLDPYQDLIVDGIRFRFMPDGSFYGNYRRARLAIIAICSKCQGEILEEVWSEWSMDFEGSVVRAANGELTHVCPIPETEEARAPKIRTLSPGERLLEALCEFIEHEGFKREI